MTIRAGMDVICVDARPKIGHRWYAEEALIKGKIYRVTGVHPADNGNLAVWLSEVSRCEEAIAEHGPKAGYDIRRFRPVVRPTRESSTETGMKTLYEIAAGIRVVEDA